MPLPGDVRVVRSAEVRPGAASASVLWVDGMPRTLLWVSMTGELWCLVGVELCLDVLAVVVWLRHRRAPRPSALRSSAVIMSAVPAAAILTFGIGAARAFLTGRSPTETARALAIGVLTMMHSIWLWMPFVVVPALVHVNLDVRRRRLERPGGR